ncbi:MAG: site-2 protease family protein [Candidatus Aminicenantaceae bacterium]
MKNSLHIGKIFGIDLFIDFSWFLIFVLFTWMLAVNYFPPQHPDWPKILYWVIGIVTSLCVFVSVLVHELAHSLVAIKQGETVRSITLFILGGVAKMTQEPKQPLSEFTMALIGPLVSFSLGLVLLVSSLFISDISEPFGASAFYLGIINIVLAVFNLLPGFPMDGGRVLRSIVWKITGDLRKATRVASLSGQGFSFLFIFIGILQIFWGNLSGLWLIFIGWFLYSAAVRGYNQVNMSTMLQGVRAKDLMTEDYGEVPSNLEVGRLINDYILKKKGKVFVVSDDGILKGIVCFDDIKSFPKKKWAGTRVVDIMTSKKDLYSVSPETDGNKVLTVLTSKGLNQIPVVKDGEIKGIVCRSDILKYVKMRSDLKV